MSTSTASPRIVLELDEAEVVLAVARDDDGTSIGFASAGPARDGCTTEGAWELYSLFVVAGSQGRGLGGRLLDATLGDRPVRVWVGRVNRPARAFYTRHGFVADGATQSHETTGEEELRMVRGGQW